MVSNSPISALLNPVTLLGCMAPLLVVLAIAAVTLAMKGRGHLRRTKDRPRNIETTFSPPVLENHLGTLPYRTRDDFLTQAEISFFHVLSSVVGPDHYVFPKVRLSDVLFVSRSDESLALFNRINQKHLDFLICSREGMRPVLGVELDDSSHWRQDRRERDEFVDQAFEAAGLRLARVPARYQYDPRVLVAELGISDWVSMTGNGGLAKSDPEKLEPPSDLGSTPRPSCPKCGVPMVRRVAANGLHKGEAFWGCVNYPQCREILLMGEKANQTTESATWRRESDCKATKPLRPIGPGLF